MVPALARVGSVHGGWRSSTSPTASTCQTGRPRKLAAISRCLPTLEPLAPFKDDLLVLTGLAQHNAEALGDGPGDHARSLACFLTGTHPLKTDGADIRVGISVDQVAAQKVGTADAASLARAGHRTRCAVGQLRLGL